MKWFGSVSISADPNKRALQCLDYLKYGDSRTEYESTKQLLLETIIDHGPELDQSTVELIMRLMDDKIRSAMCLTASESQLDIIVRIAPRQFTTDCYSNPNLKARHLSALDLDIEGLTS